MSAVKNSIIEFEIHISGLIFVDYTLLMKLNFIHFSLTKTNEDKGLNGEPIYLKRGESGCNNYVYSFESFREQRCFKHVRR